MEFIAFLVFVWVLVTIARRSARAQQLKQIVPPPDWFGLAQLPPGHVLQVDGTPGVLSARAPTEESTSELIGDETAYDHDLNLAAAEVVSLEQAAAMSVAPRPLPADASSLEHEVDWNAEHERFHKRYVDVRPVSQAAAHGLLDDLRDPAGARRAVLMAEILGPPVSMRR